MAYYHTQDIGYHPGRLRIHDKPECIVGMKLLGLEKRWERNISPGCPVPDNGKLHICHVCGEPIEVNKREAP